MYSNIINPSTHNRAHCLFPSSAAKTKRIYAFGPTTFAFRLPQFTRLHLETLRINEECTSAGLLNMQYSEASFYCLPLNSKYIPQDTILQQLDWVLNVMAHALKPDSDFRRNGRVHLNRRGRQFSRLLEAEVFASAVVMLDTPCSEVVWRVLATPLHSPVTTSLPFPCFTVCHHISNGVYQQRMPSL